MEISHNPRKYKVKSSIYLLPNLVTAASLFFGLLAIKYSFDGRIQNDINFFVYASYAILAAAVCDCLDGSIARLTRTQSAFGVQLDSLCDMVSFGVTPAVVAYQFALCDVHKFGFCAAFIYAICGALRLARFNVQSSLGKASGNFTGIPIPMAAAPIAIFILAQAELSSWTSADHSPWEMVFAKTMIDPDIRNNVLIAIVFLLALGMISSFEYLSHKAIKLPQKRPFRFFASVIILGSLLFYLNFVVSLAVLLIIYCFHGPILWLFTHKDKAHEEEELFVLENPHED